MKSNSSLKIILITVACILKENFITPFNCVAI